MLTDRPNIVLATAPKCSRRRASIADLKSMLMAASLSLADGTLRTTRTQTLAVLKFVKAKQPSVGIVTVRNSERGLTTPMRANLRAIQRALEDAIPFQILCQCV